MFLSISNGYSQIGFNKIINDTVKINNWQNVYIFVDSFKNAEKFEINHSQNDSIISFQVVVDALNAEDLYLSVNNGSVLKPYITQRLKQLQSGDRLLIDTIRVKSSDGIIIKTPFIIYYITD